MERWYISYVSRHDMLAPLRVQFEETNVPEGVTVYPSQEAAAEAIRQQSPGRWQAAMLDKWLAGEID